MIFEELEDDQSDFLDEEYLKLSEKLKKKTERMIEIKNKIREALEKKDEIRKCAN